MLIRAFYCVACGNCQLGKDQWLRHLVSEGHQRFARKILFTWDENERNCCLVIVAQLPVGGDDRIVQYLSSGDSGTFVTDFVWWEEEQPTVGFVRFRSPERAREVLASLQNQQFTIEPNQICNVQDGGAIPEIKWKRLKELVSNDDKDDASGMPAPVSSSNDNSSQMLAFGFYCSVCRESHLDKHRWLQHLLQDSHQRRAREELLLWDESDRANALVVFGKLPVGDDTKIIEYLSKDDSAQKFAFPTDFVWWPERNRVGFVQFKSVEIKREVLSSLQDLQFEVGHEQVCKVKDGGTISDLEWNGLHPDSFEETGQHIVPKLPQSQPSIASINNTPQKDCCSIPEETSVELKVAADDVIIGSDELDGLDLKTQLSSILNRIQIPDQDYNLAQGIMTHLQRISKREGHDSGYLFRAALSRHWLLKLKSPAVSKEMSIVLYAYQECEDLEGGIMNVNQLEEMDKQLFSSVGDGGMKLFLSYPAHSAEAIRLPGVKKGHGFMKYAVKNIKRRGSVKVLLNSNPFFVVEAQLWKLVKYLCSFHPVCYPVLAVAYCWAEQNSVLVGEVKGTCRDVPDPMALFWLLILFFQREGLIPPTNLILTQPHKTLKYLGVDIGFSNSSSLVNSWKEKQAVSEPELDENSERFAEEVFIVLCNFFFFCGITLGEGNGGWIVNTRDGELLPLEELVESEQKFEDSKLRQREHSDIRRSILLGGDSNSKIVILHPLMMSFRISATNAVRAFEAMKETGVKLMNYLDPPSALEMKNHKKLDFHEFLELLKVEKYN